MLLDVNNVSKFIKHKEILKDISFKLYRKDRIGIVGRNGVGKTTLLRIITSDLEADSGSIKFYGSFGYLPQNLFTNNHIYVYELMNETNKYGEFFSLLNKFGLKDIEHQKIESLSGGEKTKLYLIKLLLINPDVLILDEPTNHIDNETKEWLEDFINNFNGAVLMVTHDRYFLDKTVAKIFELENKSLKEYNGGYTFYAKQKKVELDKARQEYIQYVKEKKKLEIAARKHMERANKYNNMSKNDFQRHKAAKIAKRSKTIISRIKNMEEKKKPEVSKNINIRFEGSSDKISNILVRAEGLSKSYDRVLFENVSFNINRNSRIGLIGKNGVGKSTLLKGLVGKVQLEGNLYIAPSTKIGYFSQEFEELNLDFTILEELKNISNDESYVRTMLGSMLFPRDDVYKKISNLSYGEKVRVAFLKLILEENNLLILDELTNFLDIPTKEIIEDALLDYKGAILFVSHDRYFINKVAEEIWELLDNGMTQYLGDYSYFLNKKSETISNKGTNIKEKILKLQMDLSYISFKLINCSDEEKIKLENEYFNINRELKRLKEQNE
ncbi:ribosomal protection-like ABC-F family protein [Caldisalinibacter kiritimatiensis]|uniref:ATPase component of ABC transporter n=1 Tax=Caldisalinibacter kiritimatiensis TaxID=1304284 RepID=R1AUH0_9FIRM|nr:ABC-F type ribosomal protection protein [Caldisalinibacter kiritimatiensis]EOD00297.1 ATPase component of ABC transporter [Caldisalinibacter kiritimatiensis]